MQSAHANSAVSLFCLKNPFHINITLEHIFVNVVMYIFFFAIQVTIIDAK